MNDQTIFTVSLIAAHFAGDWIAQPRWMALNKSKEFSVLVGHLLIVTAFLHLPFFLTGTADGFILALLSINMVLHGLIDWFIWRIYAAIRGENVYSDIAGNVNHDYYFYSTIAIDQFLHISILLIILLP